MLYPIRAFSTFELKTKIHQKFTSFGFIVSTLLEDTLSMAGAYAFYLCLTEYKIAVIISDVLVCSKHSVS